MSEEKLTAGHARALLGVDDEEIQRKVARNIIEQSLSVRETERAIKRIIAGTNPSQATMPAQKRDDPNVRTAEMKLRRRFGTQVRVIQSPTGTGGKIEIEYYSDSDLHRIYQLLSGEQGVTSA